MSRGQRWEGWDPGPRPTLEGGGAAGRKTALDHTYWRERYAVTQLIREFDPVLYRGDRGATIPQLHLEMLIQAIRTRGDERYADYRVNFLAHRLNRGVKKLGWDIPKIPPPQYQLHPQRPRIVETTLQWHSIARAIDHRHQQALYDPQWHADIQPYLSRANHRARTTIDERGLHAGQILVQAILHGGVLASPVIRGLGRDLSSLSLDAANGVVMDIPLAGEKNHGLAPRRWFTDSISGMLLLRFHKRWNNWPDESADTLIAAYLAGLGIPRGGQPSLNELAEGASVTLEVECGAPPFVTWFARQAAWGPSVGRERWISLVLDRWVPVQKPVETESQSVARRRPLPTGRQGTTGARDVVRSLRNVKKASHVAEARKKLVRFIEERTAPDTLPAWLADWAHRLLRQRSKGGRGVKVTTVRTYLGAIAAPLERHLVRLNADRTLTEPLDMSHLEEGEWQDLYDCVSDEAVGPHHRAARAWHLADFHHHLRLADQRIPAITIEGYTAGSRVVDANLVPPPAYRRLRRLLQQDTAVPKRVREISDLLTVIAYRLGLRRHEIADLSLADLSPNGLTPRSSAAGLIAREPQLTVRNNSFKSLKRISSYRRLPLAVLMTADELRALLRWYDIRRRETNKELHQARLFTLAAADDTKIDEHLTYTRISKALRLVCHDESMHFHALRHSTGSILLLRCFAVRFPALIPDHWRKSGKAILLPHSDEKLASMLLAGSPGTCIDSRRVLFAISQILGHLEPGMTVTSYIHTLDAILGAFVRSNDPTLTPGEQAALLGRDAKHHRKSLDRHRRAGFPIQRECPATELIPVLAQKPQAFELPSVNSIGKEPLRVRSYLRRFQKQFRVSDGPPHPLVIYRVIQDQDQGFTAVEAAYRHNRHEFEAVRWYEKARELNERYVTKKGRRRFTPHWRRDDPPPDPNRLPVLPGLSPAPPTSERGKALANDVFQRLVGYARRRSSRVLATIDDYCNQAAWRKPDVTYGDEASYLAFLDLLDRLDIPSDRVFLLVRPNRRKGAATQRDQRTYWATRFNLAIDSVLIDKARNQSKGTRHPMGRVKLRLCDIQLKHPYRSNWNEIRFAFFCSTLFQPNGISTFELPP